MTVRLQGAIGIALALCVAGSWLALQLYCLFVLPVTLATAPLAIAVMAILTWLYVGLFIIGHDAMHGSLAPGRPSLNRAIGRAVLFAYAGFSFDRLLASHVAHHREPGTNADPDFGTGEGRAFWPWYRAFIRRYFGVAQLAVLAALAALYLLLGANLLNLLLFWALPAIVSSAQLFYFGTYLPHRLESRPFADDHRARSSGFSWIASLLSCYHFGYHHEHHLSPHVPWWRLPSERRARSTAR